MNISLEAYLVQNVRPPSPPQKLLKESHTYDGKVGKNISLSGSVASGEYRIVGISIKSITTLDEKEKFAMILNIVHA